MNCSRFSGYLSSEEIDHMITVIWGFKKNDRVIHALQQLDINGDGMVAIRTC